MNRSIHTFCAGLAAAYLGMTPVVPAVASDRVLTVKSEQSLEQFIDQELSLPEFAAQIATYNNVAGPGTVLPVGTAISIPQPYIDKVQHGRVAYAKGDVVHTQTDLVVNPPAKGAKVFKGDTLKTGPDGFVSLTFRSGARVSIQPDSRVVINDIDCASQQSECVIALEATDGEISSEVTPRKSDLPPVKFSIDTPFLTAAVRGTAFYVDLDELANRIGVTEGLVAAQSAGQNNDLPEGKGLSVSEGVEPQLVDLLPPPAFTQDNQRQILSSEDNIGWLALDGAELYRADIATDINMTQPVASLTTVSASISPPELTAGDYYVEVAAIDENDFLGLPVKQKVAIAAIADVDRPALNISRQDGVTTITTADYEGRLELLIGNSVQSDTATSRVLEDASEALTLRLDETRDWVFRARKLIDEYTVSRYSEYYVFQGREQ